VGYCEILWDIVRYCKTWSLKMISVATSGDAHVQSLQQNTSWVNSNLSFIGSTSRLGDHYGYHWEPEPKSCMAGRNRPHHLLWNECRDSWSPKPPKPRVLVDPDPCSLCNPRLSSLRRFTSMFTSHCWSHLKPFSKVLKNTDAVTWQVLYLWTSQDISGQFFNIFHEFRYFDASMFQASEASEAGMDSVEAALEEAEKPKATVDRLRHLDT
jgi:hypothetical protein